MSSTEMQDEAQYWVSMISPTENGDYQLEVDFYDPEDPFGTEYAARFGAKVLTVQEHGPAGGHPELRFSGTWYALRELLAHYAAEGPQEMDLHSAILGAPEPAGA